MACWKSSGWYGKQFDDLDSVHPLLFEIDGEIYPVEPQAKMPVDVTKRATRHGARLRNVDHRGVVTAAMIYDTQPIIDLFADSHLAPCSGSWMLEG